MRETVDILSQQELELYSGNFTVSRLIWRKFSMTFSDLFQLRDRFSILAVAKSACGMTGSSRRMSVFLELLYWRLGFERQR